MRQLKSSFLLRFIILLLACLPASGQNVSSIDSLNNALAQAGSDLEKANIHNHLARAYFSTDLEKAVDHGVKGINWALKSGNKVKLGYAYYITGISNVELYHYSKAIEQLEKALKIQLELEDHELVSRCYYKLGVSYFDLGEYNQAIDYLLKGVELAKKMDDKLQLVSNYMEIASVFNEMGGREKAIEYEKMALRLAEENGFKDKVTMCHNNMATIYIELEKYELALDHYDKALQGWHKEGKPEYEAVVYLNLGLTHSYMGDHEKALKYYRLAMELADPEYLIFQVRINRLMAVSLMETGANDEAIGHLHRAKELAIRIESVISEHQAYETLAELYKREGKLDSALYYFSEFSRLRDTVLRKDAWDKSIQMEAAYSAKEKKQELALKNKEVELLNKEKEMALFRRNMIIVISVLIVLFFIVLYSRQRIRHRKGIQLHTAQMEIEKLKREGLERDLMHKNKQLISYALQLEQKRDMISEIKEKVNGIEVASNNEQVNAKMNNLNNYIDFIMNTEEDWEEFKMHYEQVHINFFKNLKERFPDLSNKELRLCALLNLNLSTKEIANILRLSPKSVEIARYRLRKKLDLNKGENLIEFIIDQSSTVSAAF